MSATIGLRSNLICEYILKMGSFNDINITTVYQPLCFLAASVSASLHVLHVLDVLLFSRFSLVLPQLRNLNVLDLRHISELNNETVMEVVRKCRNLSSLNLCLNWSINDRYVSKCGLLFCSEHGDTMQLMQTLDKVL